MTTLAAHAGGRRRAASRPGDAAPEDPVLCRLVERSRCGDRRASAELLERLQDRWFRFCVSLLGSGDAAREAVQETALRFLQGLADFRGHSRLETWALGIALNVCRESIRKRLRHDGARDLRPPIRDVAAPPALAVANEQRDRLRELLDRLPQRQREAIVLRYFEQLSVEQAAAAMDCATGTVKATVSQALASLRRSWSPQR